MHSLKTTIITFPFIYTMISKIGSYVITLTF